MGNTPSTPSPVEVQTPSKKSTHKLSKPRTGNPVTTGLLPNGISGSTSRFPNARMSSQALPLSPIVSSTPVAGTSAAAIAALTDTKEATKDKTDEVPAIPEKDSRRRSLLRSLSYQRTSSTGKPNRRNSSVGPAPKPAVAEKVPRANSMTYESSRANSMTFESTKRQTHIAYYAPPVPENPRSSMGSRRTSWNYDYSSYEVKRLLNLEEEPTFEQAAELSERLTAVSESTWKSSNPTHAGTLSDAPISRANSDLSLYTPVRRRSIIQTPGVATRTTRASPAQSRHRAPSFRHSHPPTPSMSRHPSHDSMRSGVISMPPRMMEHSIAMPPPISDPAAMVQPVVTPCEHEYVSIGAFKLGSLRITNGAASPVSPELEGSKNAGPSHMGVIQERTDYFLGTSAIEQSGTTDNLGNKAQEIVAPQPRAVNLSPIAASFQEVETKETITDVVVEATPQEYLAEIAFSDFFLEESIPLSPELQTTSKHTALEDELFEDEGNLEYSSVEVLDVRFDLNAKSQGGGPENALLTLKTVTRTDSGFVSASSPAEELPSKPLTKADSGYSSNISLRSFQTSKSHVGGSEYTRTLEKQFSASGSVQFSEALPQTPTRVSVERPAQPMQPTRAPPPVPPKQCPPSSPTPKSPGLSIFTKSLNMSPASSEAKIASPTSSKQFRPPPSPINSMRSSGSGPKSPVSARSDRSTSALSIGSSSNRPSKLQRFISSATRRSAHGPLTAHATHSFDKSAIPSIPQAVETKLHEHTGMFPITSKRLALKPKASKDTLKTIFSVGSMDVDFDAVNAVASTNGVNLPDDEDADSRTKQLVQSMQSSIANAAAHIIPLKSKTRKTTSSRPTTAGEKDADEIHDVHNTHNELIVPAEAEVTSYNWINNSLGHNPYDAAFVALGDKATPQSSAQPAGGRTMSMPASVEQSTVMSVNRPPSTLHQTSYQVKQQTLALPTPVLPRKNSRETVKPPKTKTPPPVSMMTRSRSNLRVPRQLRRQGSDSSLSRKSSRGSLRGRPSFHQQESDRRQSLSRKSSRDSIHSYPSYQGSHLLSTSAPPIPPIDPRRSSISNRDRERQAALAFQLRHQNSVTSQAYPDLTMSRRSSMSSIDHNHRSNSLSSVHSQQGLQMRRPSSTQPHHGLPQPLRYRASHDSIQSSTTRSHPPTMSNGYQAPPKRRPDPRWFNQPPLPSARQDQYGVYPPHVPRGHGRTKSVGNRGYPTETPYRILHSYNSPAYRNAPIWG